MKKVIKKALRSVGYEIIKLQKRVRDSNIAYSAIRRCEYRGIQANFLIMDPKDAIQRVHLSGSFYEPDELNLIAENFSGGTIVDVGSNVGNHAIFFGKLPTCDHVLCFEPNPDVHNLLLANIALNGLDQKITTHRVGLGRVTGELFFSTPTGNLGGTTFVPESLCNPSYNYIQAGLARIEPGDIFLGEVQPSLIKVDVEGYEVECLLGLVDTIERCKPVLFVEVAERNLPEVMRLTSDWGYSPAGKFIRYEGLVNMLFKHHSRTETQQYA